MKKLFTLVAAAVMALAANANDYTANLSVTMMGNPLGTQSTTIIVTEQGDGKYTLALNNFKLELIGGVGNIVLSDVEGTTDNNGKTRLSTAQTIEITEGDDPSVPAGTWLGPLLGAVPVSVNADMTEDNLYAVIKINGFGGIDVVFGDGGYQLPNSGFENFHTATYVDGSDEFSSQEPNAWHSFNSGVATGSNANLTKYALRNGNTSPSDEVRPGSTGTKSVKIESSIVTAYLGPIPFKSPANGTMTTGRLQAGSISATNADNCSFLDMTSTDVDGNGDPFYTQLTSKPDAITVWVKFKQGEDLGDYKYATVSAVITDGTRYQDPENQTYTNVVAKAQNAQIESNDFAWQPLTIPFDYDSYASNGVDPKAILITISTNAHPGSASSSADNPDVLYVDDIALVYNANLTGINIKGKDIELESGKTVYDIYSFTDDVTVDDVTATVDGRGAYVNKAVEKIDGGYKVTVTVTSNDYQTVNTYTFNLYSAVGEPMSFTDKMNVYMGESTVAEDLEATIAIRKQVDGTYTLSLKNFMLGKDGVGNITVEGVTGVEDGGVLKLSVADAAVAITPGDVEGVNWSLGQSLGQMGLTANISGEMENDKLNVRIDIPDVYVTVLFGENYTSGISEVTTTSENGVEAVYDLGGRKLNGLQKGVNIVRKTDGTTVKVLKK